MLTLDLRLALTLLLALLTLTAAAGAWLQRYRQRRRGRQLDRAAWEHAPVGMMRLAADAHLLAANELARAWLHLPEDAAQLPEDVGWDETLREDLTQALAQDRLVQRTVALPDGRTLHWRIHPRPHEVWVFLQDVSLAAQRGRLVDFLLKELSHELRTPLSIILTNLNLLREGHLPEETARQALDMAAAEARHLRALVADMFDLGRLETREHLALRPLPLAELAGEVVAEMTPAFQDKGVALSLTAPEDLPLVLGDATWLRRAIHNLLDNALKFCRPGDEARVHLERTSAGVRFSLCDTGPGIPPDHLPLVTERFYRAHPEQNEGSGLGLALAAEILRHHHSRLDLQSPAPGQDHGLCASFTMPPASSKTPQPLRPNQSRRS